MAEAIVLIVVGRITDLLTEDAHLFHGVRDEIQQVVTELMQMKTFLRDADSRINEERVRNLLAQVRDLVYDAEDVVETFLLKALSSERRKIQGGITNKIKRSACVLDDYVNHQKFNTGIKDIQKRIQSVSRCFRDYDIISTLEEGHGSLSGDAQLGRLKRFHTFSVVEPDLFVGFQEDVISLLGHLVDESDGSYPVIFIGGMGGLGKTTLARKLYNHSTIKKHFWGLAWVSISQKWQAKAVLQRILIGLVHEKKEEILKMEIDKLVENLLEIQQTKNCLIVLDDIWSNDAWDSLKAAFPTETSGSKLLLTSRILDVADHVNQKCFIHKPQVLDAEQSWELLRLKALPKGEYLNARDIKKMEEFGRQMVRNCAGLPLAIVVLGGILVTKPSFIEWEKVYNDSQYSLKRGKGLGKDYQKEVFEILLWSCNVLPTQLKLCFLYMGKFAEDEEVEAETLYQLWIAEGMVLSSDKREGETMMEVAESYMGELVHKSMVQVKHEDDRNSRRKFKSCQLHDLMRDLSLSIVDREDFFKVVDFKKVNDFQIVPSPEGTSSSTRQLVLYSGAEGHKSIKDHPFLVNKYNQGRARSVLVFATSGVPPILGSHSTNFRLLRVFAMEGFDLNIIGLSGCSLSVYVGKVLDRLVHLRYLSLMGCDLLKVLSIKKLELLQTLKLVVSWRYFKIPSLSRNILSRLGGLRHLYSPDSDSYILGRLGRLRHLYLPIQGLHSFGKNNRLRFDGLSKLETLENFDPIRCEIEDLPKLVSLQKLSLRVYDIDNDLEKMIKYLSSYSGIFNLWVEVWSQRDSVSENVADMWRQLLWNHKFNLQEISIDSKLPELVKIFGQQQQQLDNTHVIGASLICITTLYLRRSCLLEDPMQVLEKIPTLRVLSLWESAYVGKEMVCSAMGFPKLTHLKLSRLPNLVKWEVEERSMPILQYLHVWSCPKLEELPDGLRFLNSLETLHLHFMHKDFNDRVRVVNGEQGADFYKVAHIPQLKIEDRRVDSHYFPP